MKGFGGLITSGEGTPMEADRSGYRCLPHPANRAELRGSRIPHRAATRYELLRLCTRRSSKVRHSRQHDSNVLRYRGHLKT